MHVIQIFSDANLFAGMASDLNTTPPPDPNIFGMGPIPKRVHNINVLPSPAPPSSFLHGNLGEVWGAYQPLSLVSHKTQVNSCFQHQLPKNLS